MRNPAARAAWGMASPSSQAAWCGSPQAIWTTSRPSCFMRRSSSGMLLTCSDQLQTPMASGGIDMGASPGSGAGGGFDVAAERPEVPAVFALLVEGEDLLALQLGDLL